MSRYVLGLLWLLLAAPLAFAQELAVGHGFSFAVITPEAGTAATGNGSLAGLQRSIRQTNRDNLAFVVSQGIKTGAEECSDALYHARQTALRRAKNGLIVTLTAADWAGCQRPNGRSAAIERLSHLRELFFVGDFSLGATRLPLMRQSIIPKFRLYGENARWEMGKILFATLSLPAPNNHYLAQAGRNSEFEDRRVANRDWLNKLFLLANSNQSKSIVLFTDANPLVAHTAEAMEKLPARRDGFIEVRQQLQDLASQFPGKVVLIHRSPPLSAPAIPAGCLHWKDNIGHLMPAPGGWTRLTVDEEGNLEVTSPGMAHTAAGKKQSALSPAVSRIR